MKTKEISNQLLDGAIDLAMYSLPGMMDTDKEARLAYRTLVTEVFLAQPAKRLKRLIVAGKPRLRSARKDKFSLETLQKMN